MKTFIINAAQYSYGGAKFWTEKIQAETIQEAAEIFHKKYGVVGWINCIRPAK